MGDKKIWLVQYNILNKYYSVGFSTREAAETAVAILTNAGRAAIIKEQTERGGGIKCSQSQQ